MLLSEQTGSASWREYGIDYVVQIINNVVSNFPLESNSIIAGIAVGLPCFGESEDGDDKLRKAFSNAFPKIPIYLTNDVEVGWAGSLNLEAGVNVVAGTGSIAFGKNENGETARCGGWSEFFSDEGSCYWLGYKVLQMFSKQADGRVKKDALYEVVRKEFSLKNDFEIIDLVHNEFIHNRDKVAALQFLARDAALSGSNTAKALYKEAADELCCLVAAIRDQLHFSKQPFPVSYSGGLFKTGELILSHYLTGIEKIGGKPIKPKYDPVYGAVLLAFEKNCPDNIPKLRKRLDETL